MIPPLDTHGLLPPGEHCCTWPEVREAFGFNEHRRTILALTHRFLDEQMAPIGLICPLYVDGSFVRGKPLPSDIDIVLDMTETTSAVDLGKALALRLQAKAIKHEYRVDLWVRHPLIPNDLVAFFQYLGAKAAVELHLKSTHPKGILRINP